MDQLVHFYAPTLLFHPDEQHFPCSPIFPIDRESGTEFSAQQRLGTAESRNSDYLALPLEKKAQLARIYYRVRSAKHDSEEALIIDYWLYYIWNDYRVRGGLFPVWFDRSHPNDLEHIHFVLRELPGNDQRAVQSRFRLEAIYSSAHEGAIPANRFYSSSRGHAETPLFLVELGSHAAAPDADKDGVFTPGADGGSGYKLVWGVRDRGITWIRYSPSYADRRSGEDAIVFSPRSRFAANDSPEEFTYQLIPARVLSEQFRTLGMTTEKRKELFETKVPWLRRITGSSSGESNKLLKPPEAESGPNSIGLNGFSSTERGVILGATSLADTPGVFLGGRYAFLHGVKYLPDLIFELDGILTTRKKGYLTSQFYLSYPASVATKLLGGAGLLTDHIDFRNRQWEWVAGMEVRLGHVQIYVGYRSGGSVNDEKIDIRVAYFF